MMNPFKKADPAEQGGELQLENGPASSPDILAAPPKRGVGVRRLNSVPTYMVGGLVLTMGAVLIYSMNERSKSGHGGNAEEEAKAAAESQVTPAVLVNAPTNGVPDAQGVGELVKVGLDPNGAIGGPPEGGGAYLVPAVAGQAGAMPAPTSGETYPSPYEAQWRQYDQTRAAITQSRFETTTMALGAGTAVDTGRGQSAGAAPASSTAGYAGALAALQQAAAAAMPPTPAPAQPDSARRGAGNQPSAGNYSSARLEAPLSATELKAGTVIPAVMIGGVNSDLPGQIVGQVTRNVYDSTTGRYLLIPQGAKLVGSYDSDVAFGQSRVLVAWKRLILPDGASFDLGAMPGADQGGYAGFRDKVDNHYRRTFGSALMVSLFSAGIQLSQPQATNNQNVSAGQTTAAALGQEMGQLGMEVARRNLSVKPELKIRPGYRFNIQVTQDLVMREWRGR